MRARREPCPGVGQPPREIIGAASWEPRNLENKQRPTRVGGFGRGVCPECERIIAISDTGRIWSHVNRRSQRSSGGEQK